jgi:hypothetical protein
MYPFASRVLALSQNAGVTALITSYLLRHGLVYDFDFPLAHEIAENKSYA